jgi:hypothetical protein
LQIINEFLIDHLTQWSLFGFDSRNAVSSLLTYRFWTLFRADALVELVPHIAVVAEAPKMVRTSTI